MSLGSIFSTINMDFSASTSTISSPSSLLLFDIKTRVPVTLRSSNYLHWNTLFVLFLSSQNLLRFIDGSLKAPPVTIRDETGAEQRNPEYQNWLQTDQMVLSWILATLSEKNISHLLDLDTAQEAWKKLEDVYTRQHMEGESRSMQQLRCHKIVAKEKGKTNGVKNEEIDIAAWKDSMGHKVKSLNDINRKTVPSTIVRVPSNEETDIAAWKDSMGHKVNSLKVINQQTVPSTIVRVPSRIRRFDNVAYEPQIVSIGPYYRGKEKLQTMEEQKWLYLHDFLARKREVSLDDFLNDMHTLEKKTRNCYSKDVSLSSCEFVEMMVLDGCFVLEFFLKFNEFRFGSDPILARMLVKDSIGQDLLLVENQLPLFVLSHIFDTYGPSNPPLPLDKLSMKFFSRMTDAVITNSEPVPMESTHHLLQLVYRNLIPPLPPQLSTQNHNSLFVKIKSLLSSCPPILPICRLNSNDNDSSHASQPRWNIPCIQKLQEAGIKISRGMGQNFLDIKFNRGVMEIPNVDIDDFTNIFLRNMIAYEHIHRPSRQCFTLYALFMDDLINTTKDVEELQNKGIIENSLGSLEDVIVLFNQIGKGSIASWDDHSMKFTEEINRYCSSKWHVWWAKLVHDYFSNPLAVIALIEALFLLLLIYVRAPSPS